MKALFAMWRTSATRCDVHIAARGTTFESAGTPSSWSTWWIVDGSDEVDALLQADTKANLSKQIHTMVEEFHTVHCF